MREKARRVVVVEDHPLMRKAVEELLADNGYEVVGLAAGFDDGLEVIERTEPDAVVADLSLANADGCELIRIVKERWRSLPVAVFSMHTDQVHVQRAFRAGAQAYVAKSEVATTLLGALEEVLAGGTYLSPRLVLVMVRDWVDANAGSGEGPVLSAKEREVFRLFGMGYSVLEIARRLERSHKTVETHCARIKKKLGVTSNRDLLRQAIEVVRVGGGPEAQGPNG